MVQNVLRAIGGIGVYDAISICIFMLVFIGVVIWTLGLKKSFVHAMSALPLQDDAELKKGNLPHE